MLQKSKKLNLLGQALLLLATLVWGTSFVILKDTIAEVPAMFVIALRFLFAGFAFFIVFFKNIKGASKYSLTSGLIVGLMLAGAYVTQTYGLSLTTPGRNAFVTSSYCVMCPFLMWIFFKQKPTLKNVVCAVLCIVGIGLIALSGDNGSGEKVLFGDGLTLISAVFFGLQIIFLDRFQRKGADTKVIIALELLTAGVVFSVITLAFELPYYGIEKYVLSGNQLLNIGYLAVACTLFAQAAQTVGQKFTTANQSSLILSLESVFGMLFSVAMGAEKLSVVLGVGFAVVFTAIIISELQFQKKARN